MTDVGQQAFSAAAQMAADYLSTVDNRPVRTDITADDQRWFTEQRLEDLPRALNAVLDDIRKRVLPYPMGNGHRRFFGWVNSAPSPAGVMVESLAAALNPSCAGGDHAGVLLERTVVRWLAELLDYPSPPAAVC